MILNAAIFNLHTQAADRSLCGGPSGTSDVDVS